MSNNKTLRKANHAAHLKKNEEQGKGIVRIICIVLIVLALLYLTVITIMQWVD